MLRASLFALVTVLLSGPVSHAGPLPAPARAANVGVAWAWSGGVTAESAVITARLAAPGRLVVQGPEPAASAPQSPVFRTALAEGQLHRFVLASLRPDTVYSYHFVGEAGARLDEEPRSFRTFPVPGTPTSFRFAAASCSSQTNSPVYAAALRQRARFFLHTGDFHYFDIAENDPAVFRAAYDTHLTAPHLRALLAQMPLLSQWDDHDFGPNDSNRDSPSREAALRNFRELIPGYPLAVGPDPLAPTDQSFTVGRVHFILSDLRSQRDPRARRMMSADQDAWFRRELLAARDAGRALIVWISTVPWNGPANDRSDRWQGYAAHRAEIADFLKAQGLASRMLILAGDAHMTGFDDGRNSDFATDGGAPLRVLQAGPISGWGSYKGGPYSHGAAYKGPDKFFLQRLAVVDIEDDGKALRVKWSGREGSDGLGDKVLVSERDFEGLLEGEFTVP